MSSQLKHRRGSSAAHAAFTGAQAEFTYNTDTKEMVVHDGATAGGFPGGGFTGLGSGSVPRSANDKHRDVINVLDYMTVAQAADIRAGTLTLDVSTPVQSALTDWKTRVNCELVFAPGKYRINTALSVTFTANDTSGKSIRGFGAQLCSYLAGGYMLTIASQAIVRYIEISGLQFLGGAAEAGCLKMDGGLEASSQFLYGFKLDSVKFDNFNGNGLFVTRSMFEGALFECQARALSSNLTGVGMLFDSGVGGVVSSVDLYGCITVNGLHGVQVVSPTSDVKIMGGTFIQAQQEGVILENSAASVVMNCHIENNWRGAASLATGGAGLKVINSAYVMGVGGTTNEKQKYIVGVYGTAALPAMIIGGTGLGATVKYAYIDGAAGTEAWILSNNTYDVAGTNVTVHQMGLGLAIGGGTSKGRSILKSNGADYQEITYRWSGAGTDYYGLKFVTAAAGRFDISVANAAAAIGAEAYGNPVISYAIGNKLSFFNAAPVVQQASAGAAVDLASAITLANALRTALLNLGLTA